MSNSALVGWIDLSPMVASTTLRRVCRDGIPMEIIAKLINNHLVTNAPWFTPFNDTGVESIIYVSVARMPYTAGVEPHLADLTVSHNPFITFDFQRSAKNQIEFSLHNSGKIENDSIKFIVCTDPQTIMENFESAYDSIDTILVSKPIAVPGEFDYSAMVYPLHLQKIMARLDPRKITITNIQFSGAPNPERSESAYGEKVYGYRTTNNASR